MIYGIQIKSNLHCEISYSNWSNTGLFGGDNPIIDFLFGSSNIYSKQGLVYVIKIYRMIYKKFLTRKYGSVIGYGNIGYNLFDYK